MKHLAIDIGAESGRAVLGELRDHRLHLSEIHRFQNKPIQEGDSLFWNAPALVASVKTSLDLAGSDIASVGIDTWAVDYVLLDVADKPINAPHHYRDARTSGMLDRAKAILGEADIYGRTGIQFLPFNTLYQLLSEPPEVLGRAKTFLTIPDYLNFVLCGKKTCEFTNATTTQFLDATTRNWATDMLAKLGLPTHIFPKIVRPGTILGQIGATKVVAPACHDTGSAVAGTPIEKGDAWISSGTWSIMGIEHKGAVINDESLAANITNEGGVNNTYRVSKNVAGMWLIQQCRAAWGDTDSYADLMSLAESAKPNAGRIDPDHADFFAPGDMPARINHHLATPVEGKGQIIRIILESLADRYATVLAELEQLTGQKTKRIFIVGGGSQNALLNQLTANATGCPVAAGPVEATAIGNLVMQMIALDQIPNLAEARKIIAASFPSTIFEPRT